MKWMKIKDKSLIMEQVIKIKQDPPKCKWELAWQLHMNKRKALPN